MFSNIVTLLCQIYCTGPLLDAVQRAHLFQDSKHFVDMALKKDPVTTLNNFRELGIRAENRSVLKNFVDEHFDAPATELTECHPDDWNLIPKKLSKIADPRYRKWALELHRLWKVLCRQVRPDVRDRSDHYSLLYVPHPFVVPGGRFREFYYWDSFWILKGLYFSEMYATARGMIRNFAYFVDRVGFVPNGGRVYYLKRSQPPLLIAMVYDYYLATGDYEFVFEMLPTLEKEYYFWLERRNVVVKYGDKESYTVFQYKAESKIPRPESYREDTELVEGVESQEERELVWQNLASAAESGWDFSTRWFAHTGPSAFQLNSIRTNQILPVDLNAFMCMNARIMADLFEMAGAKTKMLKYRSRYEKAKAAMKRIFWNGTDGIWYDFDTETGRHVRSYYVSNMLPLYAHCYDDDDHVSRRVYNYFERVGALNFTKGVPTSFHQSGQQWDDVNAWPPLMHMLVEAFRTSGDQFVAEASKRLATQWLSASYKVYAGTNAMYEKYNVSNIDEAAAGSGGEYEVQIGFGWTNGVILDFISKFSNSISPVVEAKETTALKVICLAMFPAAVLISLYLGIREDVYGQV